MKIELSEHFTFRKLIRFAIPSIIMMLFTSIYGVVDGLFVSNFVGKTAFSAVNFVIPILMILGSVGFMFGTGGGAIIAKTLGEDRKEDASNRFSMFVYSAAILGLILAILGFLFLPQLLSVLGAEGKMLKLGILYGRILMCSIPGYVLQYAFQSLCITSGKPDLGLKITVISGLTNMVLDVLLIAVIPLGIVGAAIATALSQWLGGLIPIIYFARENSSYLRLVKPTFNGRILINACINGSSELLSNVTMSIVSILYNMQLLKYAGEDGVAAYGILMYVAMIFIAIYLGYSIGTAPIVSYNYGAQNYDELKSLRKKSTSIIVISSIVIVVFAQLLASPLASIFASYDQGLYDMTVSAFRIFSFSFLFCGFGIWSSSLFTALNNGPVSAAIAFLRTLVFQVTCVFTLPLIFGINGIWMSDVIAELLAAIVGFAFLIKLKKKYQY